jgi:hypothetical protein
MRISAFLLLLAVPAAAGAQLRDVLPGSRVRVQSVSSDQRVEGTLMSHSPDSMVVAVSGAVRTALPYVSVSRLQVSHGKSRGAGAIRGMKIGAMIGGGTALLLAASLSGTEEIALEDVVAVTGVYAISGGLWGLAIGSLVGAEQWRTVYADPSRRSVAATTPIRPSVALRFSF